MNPKIIYSTLLILLFTISINAQDRYFTKSGNISFFSYTLVEDIKADNDQVLSILNTENGQIVIKILMRSFHFKKALMQEHFNENYIESHKYPKAIFKGNIKNYEELKELSKTEITGKLTIRGIEKEVVIKANIENINNEIILKGDFKVQIADFDIKIPAVVSKNISKTIEISFELNHKPYKS